MQNNEGKQRTDWYTATRIIPSYSAIAGGRFLQVPRSPPVIRFIPGQGTFNLSVVKLGN